MTITIFLTAHLRHDSFLPGKVELELDDPHLFLIFLKSITPASASLRVEGVCGSRPFLLSAQRAVV